MKISVIIPTYNREEHLKNCLSSLLNQRKVPYEILVIDNSSNYKAQKVVNNIMSEFDKKETHLYYFKNTENSGAIARNLGAFRAKGDLIAFLDDDVILDGNYYYEIEKVFFKFPNALGVQGCDKFSYDSYQKTMGSFFRRSIYQYEKIFMVSSFFEKEKSRVLPSLCVTNPNPGFDLTVQSEWISTCAGVFSKEVFKKFKFDSQFKKYSWNEYLDFSYSIYLEDKKSLFVTSKATYVDVQTSQGRLPPKELIYMSEVYDIYIFLKIFNMTYKNILIYVWSKFGRMAYNIIRILTRHPKNIKLILDCLYAPLYVLLNFSKIKKGNLDFFNKTLS